MSVKLFFNFSLELYGAVITRSKVAVHCSGRRFIAIEETHDEVTYQINCEEAPVTLWYGLRSIETIVDAIDPHVPNVVEQVDWDFPPDGEQAHEVFLGQLVLE